MEHLININSIKHNSSSNRVKWYDSFLQKGHKYFFYVQLLMLIIFLILLIAPLFSPIPKYTDTIFSNTILLSQFLFWGVWYGFCLLSVIPFGRLWCGMLCPLGAVSEWVGKLGLKRNLPSWLKSELWLVVMFTIITIMGQTLDVRDDPNGMMKLFGFIFTLAIILSLLYSQKNGRPWCRYFCPIGKILGVVSRLSILEIKSNNGVKQLPKDKKYYIQGKLCPTDYNLPYKNSTNNCITCGKCISKKTNSGLGSYIRKPGAEAVDINNRDPKWSEVVFILLAPGLAAGGFIWLILNQYQLMRQDIATWLINANIMWPFNQAPWLLSSQMWNQHFNWLDIISISVYMLAHGIVLATISGILLTMAALILKNKDMSLKKTFYSLTYQFTPLAMLSIVIGLCGKFFDVMQHDFNMSVNISIAIKACLCLLTIIWTTCLLVSLIKKITNLSTIKYLITGVLLSINIIIISYVWLPAIFNMTYMSQVEKIRQHIVVPK